MGENAVPAGVETEIMELTALLGTVATNCVADKTVLLAAGRAPNRICVAPVKLVPVRVTLVPARPEAGVKLAIPGATKSLKW